MKCCSSEAEWFENAPNPCPSAFFVYRRVLAGRERDRPLAPNRSSRYIWLICSEVPTAIPLCNPRPYPAKIHSHPRLFLFGLVARLLLPPRVSKCQSAEDTTHTSAQLMVILCRFFKNVPLIFPRPTQEYSACNTHNAEAPNPTASGGRLLVIPSAKQGQGSERAVLQQHRCAELNRSSWDSSHVKHLACGFGLCSVSVFPH